MPGVFVSQRIEGLLMYAMTLEHVGTPLQYR